MRCTHLPAFVFCDSCSHADDPSGNSETPVQVTHAGQDFIRTKSGNLIAKSVVTPSSPSSTAAMRAKRERLDHLVGTIKNVQSARAGCVACKPFSKSSAHAYVTRFSKKKKSTLCKYFQKTGAFQSARWAAFLNKLTRMLFCYAGECRNARTCRYIHDSSKIAICPRFLRNNCPCTEATCTLSHTPNQHRMPHCVHFPNCKLGSECLYPHVHTAPDAPVCRDFAVLGWCDAGATQCTKRHVNECPEFSQTGTCSLGKSCKLPHVLRRKKDPNAKETTMPSIPVRQKRVIQPEESDEEVSGADGDERDSARVKRPRVDHLGGNADYITFIEASDEESDQEEEEQGVRSQSCTSWMADPALFYRTHRLEMMTMRLALTALNLIALTNLSLALQMKTALTASPTPRGQSPMRPSLRL